MNENDILEWHPKKFLTWNDFKAEVNPGPYQDAFSKIQYNYTWTINSEKMGKDVFFYIEKINLTTQFLKHLSWVRPKHANSLLLRHQQGFFDLAEELRPKIEDILTMKLKNKQYPTQGKNEAESKQFAKESSGILIKMELDKYFEEIFLKESRKYESETNYGEDELIQKQYDDRFKILHD